MYCDIIFIITYHHYVITEDLHNIMIKCWSISEVYFDIWSEENVWNDVP